VNRAIAPFVDVMLGNEEDFTACLGLSVAGNSSDLSQLNLHGYRQMIERAIDEYPNFKAVATTLREVVTATRNHWSAMAWCDGNIYEATERTDLEIMDRVGGGDSFASGFIYGLMMLGDPKLAVEYGAAHGALAMTTPGDTSMASLDEVAKLVAGAAARVDR
jgi:2-dehydro-3-deoxygluconokinase